MKEYLGVKRVRAKVMTLGEYNSSIRRNTLTAENPEKEGYLVVYPDGYESWCPAYQFEIANREITGMPFGHAIEAAKKGRKIARAGWNGKGIFVLLIIDGCGFKQTNSVNEDSEVKMQNYLAIDTTGLQTDNPNAPKSVIPWLASQTDMLADDWCIVD